MLVPIDAISYKTRVFILQCVQTGLITAKEARYMLFLNEIGEGK
jgi:hypothetical protein